MNIFVRYLCINVHGWSDINQNTLHQLMKQIKYLHINHSDKYMPSFDLLSQTDHSSLKYLRIDLSPSYSGVISLDLPSNLQALSISCLNTEYHSWSYLTNITDDNDDDNELFSVDNPNKETILSMNIFMQQQFQYIKFLKFSDCKFQQYQIQSIVDSCKEL